MPHDSKAHRNAYMGEQKQLDADKTKTDDQMTLFTGTD